MLGCAVKARHSAGGQAVPGRGVSGHAGRHPDGGDHGGHHSQHPAGEPLHLPAPAHLLGGADAMPRAHLISPACLPPCGDATYAVRLFLTWHLLRRPRHQSRQHALTTSASPTSRMCWPCARRCQTRRTTRPSGARGQSWTPRAQRRLARPFHAERH